jgi:hypothetical protein
MRGLCKKQEASMEIQWTDDVDLALDEAKKSGKLLLLDFTAAPM